MGGGDDLSDKVLNRMTFWSVRLRFAAVSLDGTARQIVLPLVNGLNVLWIESLRQLPITRS